MRVRALWLACAVTCGLAHTDSVRLAAQSQETQRGGTSGATVAGRQPDAVAAGRPVSGAGVEPAPGEYVIGPDDVLSVVFWRDPQLTSDVRVRPDGKISLPLLDELQAAGLTPRQLRERLTTEARRFLTEPQTTVIVKETNSRRAYITGEVARPGQYPLTPAMTVLQLIATAGGLTEYAKTAEIRLVRMVDGRSTSRRLNFGDMTQPDSQQNVTLQPGDTVVVR